MDDLATQDIQADEPQDLRSVLENAANATEAVDTTAEPAIEKAEPSRDNAGKFSAKEAQPTNPEQPTDAPPVEAKRAPSSWKKDAAAEFDKLPQHVQDEVLRREGDFHKGIEGFKSHADLGRSMEKALQPYQQTLQGLGVTPDVAVGSLLRADAMLRNGSPQEKAHYLSVIAQQYGIDMAQAAEVPRPDAYTFQLEQQLQRLQQQQEQYQRSANERETQSLNSELQEFAQTAEHFEVVRDDMAALLQAGRAKDLKGAYDMAVYANPQTRQTLLEQQRNEALKQAQSSAIASRAKAASVSVRGSSPASGSGASPTNLRAALEAAFNG
jgi:hypothetical protein